jgi:hypothetical protein
MTVNYNAGLCDSSLIIFMLVTTSSSASTQISEHNGNGFGLNL